jgi:hypothetical protein
LIFALDFEGNVLRAALLGVDKLVVESGHGRGKYTEINGGLIGRLELTLVGRASRSSRRAGARAPPSAEIASASPVACSDRRLFCRIQYATLE